MDWKFKMFFFYLLDLPVSVRQQQRHIHFLGATEKGSIMDVLKVVVNDIKEHNM